MKKKYLFSGFVVFCIGLLSLSLMNHTENETDQKDPDNCLDDLKVPKRFTPDGNDTLDFFTIDFPCPPESCEIQLFDNITGEEVFVVKHHIFQWNGLNNKTMRPCPSGIYDWKIKYMYHMSYVERKGQVLLLR